MDDIRAHTGTLIVDLRLPTARSLKERRAALRSLRDKLLQQDLATSQIGPTGRHGRAFLAIAVVSGTPSLVDERLDLAERILFQSEFEIMIVFRDMTTWSGSSLG